MLSRVLLVCLLVIGFTGLARAADPVMDAQSTIGQQISAFLEDKSDIAYGFASPAIKAKFPDKELFFEMVKKSYSPVYSPGNYAFGRSKVVGDGELVFQEVLITGRDGKNWQAVYQLQRQPDGVYLIDGVHMAPDTQGNGI